MQSHLCKTQKYPNPGTLKWEIGGQVFHNGAREGWDVLCLV